MLNSSVILQNFIMLTIHMEQRKIESWQFAVQTFLITYIIFGEFAGINRSFDKHNWEVLLIYQ